MTYTALKMTFLILACFYLAGCGLGPATTNTKRCSFITKEEAEAALGGEVEVEDKPEDNACSYNLVPASSNGRFGSIVIAVVTSDSPEFEKFDVVQTAKTEVKPISGLGDRALLFGSRETPHLGPKAIRILKGKMYVGIGMSFSTPPASEETLKSLGAKALSRMP